MSTSTRRYSSFMLLATASVAMESNMPKGLHFSSSSCSPPHLHCLHTLWHRPTLPHWQPPSRPTAPPANSSFACQCRGSSSFQTHAWRAQPLRLIPPPRPFFSPGSNRLAARHKQHLYAPLKSPCQTRPRQPLPRLSERHLV